MNTFSQRASFIWGIADLIRDSFKRGKYQDVILPLTVLRRIDRVLAPTKQQVLAVNAQYHGKLENLDPLLRRASGYAFYNTSRYDFESLLADAPHLAANLRANPPDKVRLTFEHVVEDLMQEMVNSHFHFYKQVTDNKPFAQMLLDWLFERYLRKSGEGG